VGAAIVRGFGGFSAWISGEPGAPASPAEQQAFQQQNKRSWSGFAPGTQLRRLLETSTSGTSDTLYGFRSGDELCLRLLASGAVDATSTHCAPLQALQKAKEPALVVTADEPFFSNGQEVSLASFGITSDGVSQVVLHADDGTHQALVAANAFLYVADHPKLGTRVRGLEAVAADGAKIALPFQSAPFGTTDLPPPPKRTSPGPTQLERHVSGGAIAWVEHLEARGKAMPAGQLHALAPLFLRRGKPLLARLIQPDPNDSLHVAVVVASPSGSLSDPQTTLCQMLFAQTAVSAGCSPLREFFSRAPINPGLSTASGGDQFTILSGLASDDVASIKVFLGTGGTIQLPLKGNAFLARISRAAFPIRIVGYDSHGEVLDIETLKSGT
jgi:hypothetical protein